MAWLVVERIAGRSLGAFVWQSQELHDCRWTYLHQTDRQQVKNDYRLYSTCQ